MYLTLEDSHIVQRVICNKSHFMQNDIWIGKVIDWRHNVGGNDKQNTHCNITV